MQRTPYSRAVISIVLPEERPESFKHPLRIKQHEAEGGSRFTETWGRTSSLAKPFAMC